MVESECGAVAVGRTYLLPPLSSGGASLVRPWLRFHTWRYYFDAIQSPAFKLSFTVNHGLNLRYYGANATKARLPHCVIPTTIVSPREGAM